MALVRYSLAIAALLLGLPFASAQQSPIQLRDVSANTGIRFVHSHGGSGQCYIVETVCSGLATFDYDGDGLIDVYFLAGTPLKGTRSDVTPKNRLYRNRGGFRFEDATAKAGVGAAGYGMGVAAGDYDGDGQPDLYVSNFGPNVLYRNNGDGTFADVTERARVGRGDRVGAGACFLDFDGDGNLDLFAANYIQFSYDTPVRFTRKGISQYPGPINYPPEANNLFRNQGDGTLADVSAGSGIASHRATGMGTVCGDFDGDGRTDIFVANDGTPNSLFFNEGSGRFREGALMAGVAYDADGTVHANMGADCGDYDNDGRPDLLVTSYQNEMVALYRNLGGGMFTDVTRRTGAGAGSLTNVKWGCGLVDFDNDGQKDLFIGRGHLGENEARLDDSTSYLATPVLLRNTGRGKFVNVSDSSGDGLKTQVVARGVAFDDLDNDGRIDVVILSSNRPPVVLRNESNTENHWLQIQLRGMKTNRDGVGARVRVVAGDLVQVDEVHSGRGYQSHYGSRLHFGLGKRDRVDRIEVRWIGGGADVLENIGIDRLMSIVEGKSRVER